MRLNCIHIPLVIAALFLFSCQKEVSLEKKGSLSGTTDTMFATINGTNWVAVSISAKVSLGQLTIIGGAQGGYPAISFLLEQDISYFNDLSAASLATALYSPSRSLLLRAGNGSLQIFENNPLTHRVRGSFGFQANVPLGSTPGGLTNLISGYFSVEYF